MNKLLILPMLVTALFLSSPQKSNAYAQAAGFGYEGMVFLAALIAGGLKYEYKGKDYTFPNEKEKKEWLVRQLNLEIGSFKAKLNNMLNTRGKVDPADEFIVSEIIKAGSLSQVMNASQKANGTDRYYYKLQGVLNDGTNHPLYDAYRYPIYTIDKNVCQNIALIIIGMANTYLAITQDKLGNGALECVRI